MATSLSGAEYRLVRILQDHPSRVLHRDQRVELIHGREAEAYDMDAPPLPETGPTEGVGALPFWDALRQRDAVQSAWRA